MAKAASKKQSQLSQPCLNVVVVADASTSSTISSYGKRLPAQNELTIKLGQAA